MKQCIDLNSDMGEGFGLWTIGDGVDDQIMPLISSANIATGFHAGDPNILSYTVALAKKHAVGIGAHPGFRDLAGFGRRFIKESAEALVNDIVYQVGALREFAKLHQTSIQHIKPHGALYMHAATDEAFAELLVKTLRQIAPNEALYCMAQSQVHLQALAQGHPVVCEFYADRDYNDEGSIVLVRQTKPLDPLAVAEKVLLACQQGTVKTITGNQISIHFDSVCIHSDTPGALALVEATQTALSKAGIRIQKPQF